VPDPGAVFTPTRRQVPQTRRFDGGEGIWYDGGTVHFSTKGDNRVWAYDTATGALGTIYDKASAGADAPLSGVDNLTVNPAGEVFVCEDGGDMEICVIEPDSTVGPFLQLTGEAAIGLPDRGNEMAGVIFDPSHRRLYFSAQRAYGFGVVYEVSGPFHGAGLAAPFGTDEPAPSRGGRSVSEPGLRLRTPSRVRLETLHARGLAIELELDGAETVLAALRTDALSRVPGKRGSTARARGGSGPAARRRRASRSWRRAATAAPGWRPAPCGSAAERSPSHATGRFVTYRQTNCPLACARARRPARRRCRA